MHHTQRLKNGHSKREPAQPQADQISPVRPGIVGSLIDAVRLYDRLPACRCARGLKLPFTPTPAGWQPAVPTIRGRTIRIGGVL